MIKNVSQHAFEDTLLDGVVIDIGEHKRVFSTALAALGCQVRGFEPGTIFDSYKDIPNITSHNKAVVDENQAGSVYFQWYVNNTLVSYAEVGITSEGYVEGFLKGLAESEGARWNS